MIIIDKFTLKVVERGGEYAGHRHLGASSSKEEEEENKREELGGSPSSTIQVPDLGQFRDCGDVGRLYTVGRRAGPQFFQVCIPVTVFCPFN